jgi:hypothetical protein
MEDNVGALDQAIRIFVGIMAGWEYFILSPPRWWLLAFAFFFILTGCVGRCPMYLALGGNTKREEPRGPQSRSSGTAHDSVTDSRKGC